MYVYAVQSCICIMLTPPLPVERETADTGFMLVDCYLFFSKPNKFTIRDYACR